MEGFSYWFLLIIGILNVIGGIYFASQHGKPKGKYNGASEVISALVGIIFILIAYDVI